MEQWLMEVMDLEEEKGLIECEKVAIRFFELIKEGHSTRTASRKIKKEWGYDAVFFYQITKRDRWELDY